MVRIRNSSRRNISPSSSSVASSDSSTSRPPGEGRNNNRRISVAKLVAENAMIIVARRECYMCIVVKALMEQLGANNYKVLEGEEDEEAEMLEEFSMIESGSSNGGGPRDLPAVYIGGKYLGGVDKVMESHVKGELVPMLRAAGALCL